MRCIIAGSRGAQRRDVVAAIKAAPFKREITVIISGGARGADSYGEECARVLGLTVQRYIPDWDKFGKRAGILRNQHMADNADALIAVWDGVSPGTRNMIDEANKRMLKVYVHIYTG